MFAWEVSIEGKNLLLDVGDGAEKRGLRAERYVEAWDRADAGKMALEAVELELSGRMRNAAADPPSFRITDVDAFRSASEFPATPLEFEYCDEADLVETTFVPTLPVDENFHLARGVVLTDRGGLSEGFEVVPPEKGPERGSDKTVLFVNVSAERTVDLFLALSDVFSMPGTFFFRVAASDAAEAELDPSGEGPLHQDEYHLSDLNDMTFPPAVYLFAQFWSDCGEVGYGYASNDEEDEIQIDSFKLLAIQTRDPQKYVRFLRDVGFEQRDKLHTAWDTLGPDTPGGGTLQRIDGETIHDAIPELEKYGFFFAARTEGQP